MEHPSLTPHAKYAGALRRFERLSRNHPERVDRHSEMVAAAKELVAFERENLSMSNLQREERVAQRHADRRARRALRDAIADQKRWARKAGRRR